MSNMIPDSVLILNNQELNNLLIEKRKKEKEELESEKYQVKSKNIKWYLQYLFFLFLRRKKRILDFEIPKIENIKRILIIRNDGIGDYIVSTPIIALIKHYNPNVIFDVVTSVRNDFFVKNDLNINLTFPVSVSNFKKDWKMQLSEINKYEYDLIYPLNASKTTKLAAMCRKIKSGKIVAFDHNERRDIYKLVFERLIQNISFYTHWSDKMIQFPLQSIDFGNEINPDFFTSYLSYTNTSIKNTEDYLSKNNLKFNMNDNSENGKQLLSLTEIGTIEYIVLCISAFSPGRSLSFEKNIELLKVLKSKLPKIKILISASPNEFHLAEKLVEFMNDDLISSIQFDLNTAITIFSGAKFIITPDTANTHIANAANVPTIVFYHHISFMFTWYNKTEKSVFIANKNSNSTNYLNSEIFEKAIDKIISHF